MFRTVDHVVRRRAGWTVLACTIVVVAYWAALGWLVLIDPYDRYAWGARPTISDDAFLATRSELIPAAVKNPDADLIFLGGSNTVLYSSAELKQWISGVRQPLNVSYFSPRPGDQDFVFQSVLAHSKARRVIVSYNIYFTSAADEIRPGFPVWAFETGIASDVRALSPSAMRLTLKSLGRKPFYEGSRDRPAYAAADKRAYDVFQTPRSIANVRAASARSYHNLRLPASQDCSDYPAVSRSLAPFVKSLAAKGVHVDIMMPAYSSSMHAFWQDWAETRARFGPNLLERDIAARRCLIDLLSGHSGIHIAAFEGESWIVEDLKNYRDVAHLHRTAVRRYMAENLDNSRFRITRENATNYLDGLRSRALSAAATPEGAS